MSENIKKLKRAMKAMYLLAEKEVIDDVNGKIDAVMNDYVIQLQSLQKQKEILVEALKQVKFTLEYCHKLDASYDVMKEINEALKQIEEME